MVSHIKVDLLEDSSLWDSYVDSHPEANPYHMFSWLKAIHDVYGHRTYAMAAIATDDQASTGQERRSKEEIVGILPLVHLKSIVFGNRLVSMPYFDHGGVIANSSQVEEELIRSAILLGRRLNARRIELRHLHKPHCMLNSPSSEGVESSAIKSGQLKAGSGNNAELSDPRWILNEHKVRMVLKLPDSAVKLMASFKSKLRSQIKRAVKAGLNTKVGGNELIDDFYSVFSANMRDLGSPVHAKSFAAAVIDRFSEKSRIVAVYNNGEPIAASIIVGFKDVLINPWASALKQFSRLSPNMLLYWTMLEYACEQGYRYFDFGRSTEGEGTYRFKAQWGAEPQKMYWYTIHEKPNRVDTSSPQALTQSNRMNVAVKLWRRLPISVSRTFGPLIRKHIDL